VAEYGAGVGGSVYRRDEITMRRSPGNTLM